MLNLSIATLNVCGLRDQVKRSRVIQWLKIFTFDIILLQELYLASDADFSFFKRLWDGPVYFSPSLTHHSGGVGIALNGQYQWKVSQIRRDNRGRCISILCSVQETTFRVCNVHCPNPAGERREFLNNLNFYLTGSNPLILGGDFNCVMENIDRENRSLNPNCLAGRKEIFDLVSTYNLVDCYRVLHPLLPGYTWSRRGCSQRSRLDRIYLSKELSFNAASVSPFPYSDHDCVHVDFQLSGSARRGKRYWKYNTSLSKDSVFCGELRFYYKLWSTLKPAFKTISDWWENIKGRIKQLAIQHGVRLAREKRDCMLSLQRTISCNPNKDEVDEIIEAELRGACIRSRVNFLEENEKPSAFFYREEKRRARQKVFKCIKNNDGITVSTQSEIMDAFHNFYTRLYTEDCAINLNMQDYFIKCLNSKIGVDDNVVMERAISLSEVTKAISTSAKNKSPGNDGLPYEFYLHFVDLLGNDLVDVFNDIFDNGTLTESQRTGVITLIPKKGDTTSPSNWRPISLLNTDYKLIAKILQTRLRTVLPNIVNVYQTCAVPGRTIHNNLFILRDIADFCVLGNRPCAFISIDQQKLLTW